MIKSQRDKFDLPKDVTYLNCANIAPLMKSLSRLGKEAIDQRARPYQISRSDWFEPTDKLKRNFAKLINCENHNRIAVLPSVSYGIASVAKNIQLNPNDQILVVDEQYPSNYYSWVNIAQEFGAEIKVVKPPSDLKNKGKIWNEKILESINGETKIVALGNVHWTDGTLFKLKEISDKVKQHNALLIIDGSQSIGALPFDIQEIKPDAVFAVGYKWLLGAFSFAFGYFGSQFDNGKPLEENWINRKDSHDFQRLVEYTPEYSPLAGRYNVGENSNFHLTSLMNGAIEQLLEWDVANIQEYCKKLTAETINELRELGCIIEENDYRTSNLFGIRFDNSIDLNALQAKFEKNKIYASLRGSAVRISTNVYTDQNDMDKLVDCIKTILK
ncbi:aminotransferase class V-fold PLP-dependent enzyme [Muricauda sp. JGD-17]|uniref:Aminotransferase class V-fold PLP-dependent enzyme n=1 Tax=Flagellimonas ochracea TaxID=2696472 RepID=A0A964TA61_9FLAO|nr:aminotransferase class V-fold PLP-dependent enzyme [Allomuricauda ochracea]NAY91078.1 aminotransferase class V-fold PLP-dependent enzyme [Allomuricauda ochracea]